MTIENPQRSLASRIPASPDELSDSQLTELRELTEAGTSTTLLLSILAFVIFRLSENPDPHTETLLTGVAMALLLFFHTFSLGLRETLANRATQKSAVSKQITLVENG